MGARSSGGPKALATMVPRITRAALGRRGAAVAGLIGDWSAIVGPEMAACCTPERLTYPRGERTEGTLSVRVVGAWATELQHLEPQFLERLNAYFGYRAIARLRIVQSAPVETGMSGGRPAPRPAGPLAPTAEAALDRDTAAVDDPALRQALREFGRAVLGDDEEEASR